MQLFSEAAPKVPICYHSYRNHTGVCSSREPESTQISPRQTLPSLPSVHNHMIVTTSWIKGKCPQPGPIHPPTAPSSQEHQPKCPVRPQHHQEMSGNGTLSHSKFRTSAKEMSIGYLTMYALHDAFHTVHQTKHIHIRK